MSAALPALPLPDVQTVGLAVICLLAGMTVPTRYGIERLEGFGRSVVARLPYRPPPGMDKTQALSRAVYSGPDDGKTGDQADQGGSS